LRRRPIIAPRQRPKRRRVGRGTPSACSTGSLHRADGRAGAAADQAAAGRAVRGTRVEVTFVPINSKRSRRRCHGARGASHIDLAVGRVDGPGDLTGCGKSRDFEKTAMKWARYRKHGRVRSTGYGRAPVESGSETTINRLSAACSLMFAFKDLDANIRFRCSGRGSAHRCARPETGPEDAG
jgi:hypothetical protein